MKDDRRAELRAQRGQRLGDHVPGFGSVVLTPVRRDVQAGRQDASELLAPEIGDGEVDADSAEPGAGRSCWRVPMARPVGADERFLGQVFGRRRVENDTAYGAVYREILLVVELTELGG